ncbi:hypothetical protein LshimejAT787_0406320 [Lyophyllum shimeji]|uniref:GRF-type domain-containing protein n=1 Tax=Lyophyllum shimeji TaxID=47721 RepID=A0A9P3PKX6_LYOSH|nr:hypothetical protein LshimejAT787_0406320 [Lyophyllum shimeji]
MARASSPAEIQEYDLNTAREVRRREDSDLEESVYMAVSGRHTELPLKGYDTIFTSFAALKTSQTERNPGRQYYCCPKGMSDPDRCAFWYWADDPMFSRLRVSASSPATPSSSPAFESNLSPNAHHSPPTTPRKRGFEPSLSSPELTPSQKRMKIIQEALRETTTSPPASTPGQASTTSRRSQKRLGDIREALSPSNPSKISQPADNSPGPGRRPSGYSASTSRSQSPDRASMSIQPLDSAHHEGSDGEEDAALWALVTPPDSSLEIGCLSNEPGINVGNVHSREQNAEPTHATPRWRGRDPEDPFDDSVSRSQFTNSSSSSNPYVLASTSLQRPTSLSADTISSVISSLSDIPGYVQKLERKVVAAERSNTAKAKRIQDLEQEVGRLQEENGALQKSLNASKFKGR